MSKAPPTFPQHIIHNAFPSHTRNIHISPVYISGPASPISKPAISSFSKTKSSSSIRRITSTSIVTKECATPKRTYNRIPVEDLLNSNPTLESSTPNRHTNYTSREQIGHQQPQHHYHHHLQRQNHQQQQPIQKHHHQLHHLHQHQHHSRQQQIHQHQQQQSKTSSSQFACEYPGCHRKFSTYTSRAIHQRRTHAPPTAFICQHCGSSFSTSPNLNKHIKSVHEKVKPFQCKLCDSAFAFRDGLQRHVRMVHDELRPYACKFCNVRFKNRTHMGKHVWSRHPEHYVTQARWESENHCVSEDSPSP